LQESWTSALMRFLTGLGSICFCCVFLGVISKKVKQSRRGYQQSGGLFGSDQVEIVPIPEEYNNHRPSDNQNNAPVMSGIVRQSTLQNQHLNYKPVMLHEKERFKVDIMANIKSENYSEHEDPKAFLETHEDDMNT